MDPLDSEDVTDDTVENGLLTLPHKISLHSPLSKSQLQTQLDSEIALAMNLWSTIDDLEKMEECASLKLVKEIEVFCKEQ